MSNLQVGEIDRPLISPSRVRRNFVSFRTSKKTSLLRPQRGDGVPPWRSPKQQHRAERRALGSSRSGNGSGPSGDISTPQSSSIGQFVASPLYRYWLQGGAVLLLLMGIDAAYSGDWSRIGAISKAQELQLQQVHRVWALAGRRRHPGIAVQGASSQSSKINPPLLPPKGDAIYWGFEPVLRWGSSGDWQQAWRVLGAAGCKGRGSRAAGTAGSATAAGARELATGCIK